MTTWKKIPGFDRYEVSDTGQVRTVDRAGVARILKPNVAKNGYVKYNLCQKSKYTTFLGHRLVASAFIPNPDDRPWVDHIDFNKRNNRATNLRWCTPTENNHATDRAGRRHALTNPNRAHKLTAKKAAAIRARAAAGVRTGLIAAEFGIAGSTVRRIVTGRAWTIYQPPGPVGA